MVRYLIFVCFTVWLVIPARAQQPFFTDDADVAETHRWHGEGNNEVDGLPLSSFPNLRQNTLTIKLSYGLFRNGEVGLDFPVLAILNADRAPTRMPIGLGDIDYSIKYNFRQERLGSKWPALTASLNIEPPTGNARLQLGSGLIDYYLNGIVQKTVSPKNVLRVNAGATFAGNTATGVVGIESRGTILTGGASLTHRFTKRLDLGAEVYGGYTAKLSLGRGELQQQVGGNYEISKGLTLDFGAIAGQATGSPRYGFQLGFSKDFW